MIQPSFFGSLVAWSCSGSQEAQFPKGLGFLSLSPRCEPSKSRAEVKRE